MATTNLKILTAFSSNPVQISCGNGTPDHIAPIHSEYLDLDTGIWYVNTFGGIKWAVKGKKYILDFGLDGIYGNTSTSYAYVPIEIMLPKLSTISSGATQIEAKIMVSYEIDGAATGEMQLYDYTGATAITATQTALANSTWTYKDTAFFDLTAYEGKAIRLGTKRIGGTGSDAVKIESASLLIKIS